MSELITFAELGLSQHVLAAVTKIGYETPSPIQAQAIPALLSGRNILGTAQTGTGKTAAFSLPLLSLLDAKQRTAQILVLTPTRELAIQVAEAIQKYASEIPDFHVLPLYGGQDIGIQFRALKRSVQVVVGTPGRLSDHLRRESLNLSGLKAVVLDEADEMLKMGFEEDVRAILAQAPKTCQRALFSATMPSSLAEIVSEHLGDYEEIRIQAKTATVEKITQRAVLVRQEHKVHALTRLLEHEDYDAMLIFVRTKAAAAELAEKLEARGYSATPLSGDLNQALRERTINRLKEGLVDIVVATDVAARGLDVDRITHVLNFDIPYDTESYVHRIGRTGRAGREGQAILFVSPRERAMLKTIERATRQPITHMELPTSEQIQNKRVKDYKDNILQVIQNENLEQFQELVESWSEDDAISMTDLAAALLFHAQKEQPLFAEIQEIPKSFERNDRGRSDRFERGDRGDRNDRFERSERPERGERPERSERPDRSHRDDGSFGTMPEEGFERYYLAVGREHRITPGDIVGAIANEAGLDSKHIGRIKLFPFFSTVELPQGMPNDVMDVLQSMMIRGKPSKFRIMGDEPPPRSERSERSEFGGRSRSGGGFGGGFGGNSDRPKRDERGNFAKRKSGGFGGGFGGKKPFGGSKGGRGK